MPHFDKMPQFIFYCVKNSAIAQVDIFIILPANFTYWLDLYATT